jgi:hypothetical protein
MEKILGISLRLTDQKNKDMLYGYLSDPVVDKRDYHQRNLLQKQENSRAQEKNQVYLKKLQRDVQNIKNRI